MRHLLLAKGLWGLVDGTETLAEDANAAARAEFAKRVQKAFSTIITAIGTWQLYLVTKELTDRLAAMDLIQNKCSK